MDDQSDLKSSDIPPQDNPDVGEDRDQSLSEEAISSEFEFPISDKEKRSLADELDIRRKDIRSALATVLMWLLAGTYIFVIIAMIITITVPVPDAEARFQRYTYSKDVFTLLIMTQTGLVGAVLGFYFGSSQNKGTS